MLSFEGMAFLSTTLPKVEGNEGKPLSPYAVTKLVNEIYADIFSKTYGIQSTGLRYFNVFGPKQSPTNAYAAVIPKFITSALRHTSPAIFGDGETSRDFTFIENVVQANIKALLNYTEIQTHEVINIACGERTSLNKLWSLIVKYLNCESLIPNYYDERVGDVKHSLADISKAKKNDLLQKLSGQIEDSIKVKVKTKFFFFKTINKPPVYDTTYCKLTAENMRSALFHSGYYQANVDFKADSSGKKIAVNYIVTPGKQTLIEEVKYELGNEELQRLSKIFESAAILKKDLPISKIGIYSEINRLVEIFRNNGYYKFSAAELKVQGDTSNLALTNISNNPFEQFQFIEEAQRKLDSPKIRLTIRTSVANDSSKLKKYYIKIFSQGLYLL